MARADKNNKTKGDIFAKIIGALGMLLIIAVILIMVPLTVPKIAGYEVFNVVSGSMEPEIPVGSLILVKEADPSEIQAGEIIAFTSDKDNGAVVTHRVVENDKTSSTLITKGDANELQDMNPVPYQNVTGRVEKHYVKLGFIMAGLSSFEGKIYLLCILAAGVLLNYISGRLKER